MNHLPETSQRADPDVLLVNEFDYDDKDAALGLFVRDRVPGLTGQRTAPARPVMS
jgi:hypothetical protein